VLSERTEIQSGWLAAGVPAREKKELSGSAKGWTDHAAAEYQQLRARYLAGARFENLENEPLPG
jgi:carbonic anhydrase/acetyltransferase-like protein (isoleucine patch superfamily)